MEEYAAQGLPAAYLPLDEKSDDDEDRAAGEAVLA